MTPLLITAIILAYVGVAVASVPFIAREIAVFPSQQRRAVREAAAFSLFWPIIAVFVGGEKLLDHAERWIFKQDE